MSYCYVDASFELTNENWYHIKGIGLNKLSTYQIEWKFNFLLRLDVILLF